MVQLEKSCTGYADSFILPAYFEGHSQMNSNMGPNIELINTSLNASQFQIWQTSICPYQQIENSIYTSLNQWKSTMLKTLNLHWKNTHQIYQRIVNGV